MTKLKRIATVCATVLALVALAAPSAADARPTPNCIPGIAC
jgi:hypothetical protein